MASRKTARKAPESFHFEERGGPTVFADGMRHLSQEILSSFDARTAWVATFRHESATKMKNLHHELKRKAADLKGFLSNAEASRMRDFHAMHQGIQTHQEERNRDVAGMLGGFRRDREAAASHWQSMAAALAKKRASFAR